MSKPVNGKNMLKSVATISANGDEEIGEIVSTALDSVGETGAVTVEESRTGETYLDIVEGIQFDRGYKSPYFVTDNNTMTSVLEDVVVLLVDKNIHNIKDLLPVLEGVVTSSKSMLIISEDVSGEVLSTLVLNKVRGGLKICAVKAPDFGDRRKEILQDIAILTGGTVVSPDKGMRLDKFNPEWLGTAKKAVISRDKTTIIGAEGKPEEIDKRISEIEHQIETAKTVFDKEQLQARLGRFAQGVAVMYVGGRTELEMKERKDRVDDALHATKAALEEGICPGGGSTLYYVATNVLDKFELDSTATPSFQAGFKAVTEACRKPFQQILWNLGLTKEEVLEIGQKVEKSDAWDIYDISSGNVGNAMEIGVIDPVKVVRLALQNAISVAATMATSEALIVNILDDKKRDDEEDLTY